MVPNCPPQGHKRTPPKRAKAAGSRATPTLRERASSTSRPLYPPDMRGSLMSWTDMFPWMVWTASILLGAALTILAFIVWMMSRVATGEFE